MEEELVLILHKLVGLVEEASPKLWEIAARQAEVMGNNALVGSIGFGVMFLLSVALLIVSIVRFQFDDEWGFGYIFGAVGVIGFFIAMVVNINAAVLYLGNPAYYAIKILIGLVK